MISLRDRDLTLGCLVPAAGDYRWMVNRDEEYLPPSSSLLRNIALHAEAQGFDYLLVPICPDCLDPLVLAAELLRVTNSITIVIAVNPAYCHPRVLLKALFTMESFASPGRLGINLVGSDAESWMIQTGTTLFSSDDAMLSFCRALEEFETNGLRLEQSKLRNNRLPNLEALSNWLESRQLLKIIAGGRVASVMAASYNFDMYFTFADRIPVMTAYRSALYRSAQTFGRHPPSFGIGINIIARATYLDAWMACQEHIQRTPRGRREEIDRLRSGTEVLGISYEQLKAQDFLIERNLWLGLAQVRLVQPTTLFGSYDEIAALITAYRAAGVTSFCFTAYPLREEINVLGREILPRLRATK